MESPISVYFSLNCSGNTGKTWALDDIARVTGYGTAL